MKGWRNLELPTHNYLLNGVIINLTQEIILTPFK